jgi:hypothetical protein
LEGHVVGMVTLKRIDSQGINFVIPGYILFNVFEAVVKALTTGSTLCAVCQKLISTEDEYCPTNTVQIVGLKWILFFLSTKSRIHQY